VAIAGRLTALAVAGSVCVRAAVDPDLWGHLRFGLDLAAARRLTSVDPYSFTQDKPWINHEWLSELLFALVYRGAGVSGLLVLKISILAAAFLLLAAVTKEVQEDRRWWLLAVAIFGVGPIAATFRPQLWTILGVAIVARILSAQRGFWWLPIVFAVWANMHGGWIVGAAVAALWIAGRAIDTRDIRAQLPIGLPVALAIAATIINPYGWRLWYFLATTVRMSRDISEWRPLWEAFQTSYMLLWPLTVGVVVTTAIARWRHMTWATLLPVIWLGVNGLFVSRLAPLFSEIALLAVSQAWQALPAERAPAPRGVIPFGAKVVVDALVLAYVTITPFVRHVRCLHIDGRSAPDLVAAGAFDAPDVRGRLIIPFTWGEYGIWHWGPRLRVSMDGRRETIYSDDMLDLQGEVVAGSARGRDYLARVRPEYVWLPHEGGRRTGEWLAGHGYRMDVTTPTSFIATRADLPLLEPGTPKPACFQ
jgi:hypothetical protein